MRQVQRLVGNGALDVVQTVGRSVLLDSTSVLRLRAVGTAHGRAWTEGTAWAALAMLDGDANGGIEDASLRWQLRDRLRRLDPEEFVRRAGRRARVRRFRATDTFLGELAKRVALTGTSALAADDGIARAFGLASADARTVDGYASAERLVELERAFFLVGDRSGNVTIHVTEQERATGPVAGEAAVAADLAESLDTRLRSAGLRALGDRLRRL